MTAVPLCGGGGNWATDGTESSVRTRPTMDVVARIVNPTHMLPAHIRVDLTATARRDLGVDWGDINTADLQSARRVLTLVARLIDALRTLEAK
ncbi:Uncharacterised protein [Mycobacteroides abscessus subsp. abscessus]|uniref:hypothetical protein n=1 Tax=Mycobacteroides abscessus TaxID=36809 RepID=UPI000928EF19|nr:hypothetical protein [Mycobacteroides abscessus]SHX76286.1 Uncharacterised protein [Mycobacteroides abscessus subsp. abscessus]SHY26009.1 Uncharacterised protein [Mycobacteroides abscessus subsp. abscessus]SIC26752.1 Uncharacterised protein [Mycobacteroides abscessus subsp. abscessus]SID07281.1 Uncharacterised protein [Mycobacteroides abscessus subsp. abscessus]SKV39366.1 Uncharacterised protein [Mycobacteroides abscessus subsp. abscessus]